MHQIFKRSVLALCCASALFLAGCNDDDKDDGQSYVSYDTYISEKTYDKDLLSAASAVKIISYNMPGAAGKTVKTTAMVMWPKTERPKDGWRVVVWDHGTVGLGDECAPSQNSFNPRFKNMAESLLAQGYVIVAPDYEGLGTKGQHPYLHLHSAAQSGIYAVKAVKEYKGSDIHGAWMSVGQSQGGHASLGTAEYALGNSFYKGTVAAAPASSLGYIINTIAPVALKQVLLAENAGQYPAGTTATAYAELLAYAAYVGVGITTYDPEFNYEDIFQERSHVIVKKAEGSTGENGLCISPMVEAFANDIHLYVQENVGKTALDYPGLVANFQENAAVKKFLAVNQPATKKLDKPVMIIQGELDMAVPFVVTEALAKNLQALGTDVTFVPVAGAGHTAAIVEKNAELVAFVQKNMPAK